ncbi:MAG: DUF2892 domain-containing protein [Bacteriovoracaceae bacterium]|nr:DUF2892 domain-containing protein [Bacteriovoracaceae bacterium]
MANRMSIENQIRAFAGFFIVVSLILAELYGPYWYFFTLFVGINLFQSSFTGFCPLEKILIKIQKNKSEKRN